MPINLGWYNNTHNIMQLRFTEQWDVTDFITALDKRAQYIHNVPHTVHMIYDFSESLATPRDLLAGLQHANRTLPQNQGIVVYLNANAVIKAFVLMAKRTGLPATKYLYNADTREQALNIIHEKAPRVHSA